MILAVTFLLAASIATTAEKDRPGSLSVLLSPGERILPGYPALFRLTKAARSRPSEDERIGPRFLISLNGSAIWHTGTHQPVCLSDETCLLWLQTQSATSMAFPSAGRYKVSITDYQTRETARTEVVVHPIPESELDSLRDYMALFASRGGHMLRSGDGLQSVSWELSKSMVTELRQFIANHPASRYALLAEMPLLYRDVEEATKSWEDAKDLPEQERLQQAQALLNRCRRVYEKCDCTQFRAYALRSAASVHYALGQRAHAAAAELRIVDEFPTSALAVRAEDGTTEMLRFRAKELSSPDDKSVIFGPLPGCTLPPEPESDTRTESAAGENRVSSSAFAWVTAIVGILVAALAAILLYRRSRPSGDGAPPRTPST